LEDFVEMVRAANAPLTIDSVYSSGMDGWNSLAGRLP
jgi:hypothetical protein